MILSPLPDRMIAKKRKRQLSEGEEGHDPLHLGCFFEEEEKRLSAKAQVSVKRYCV